MRVLFITLVAVCFCASASAAGSEQFDLICSGSGGATPPESINWQPLNIHLRIDLTAKRWCEGDCLRTREIAEVQPNHIWLERQSDYEKAKEIVHFRSIDRVKGDYMRIQETRYGSIEQKGECRPSPFSGFPTVPTKF